MNPVCRDASLELFILISHNLNYNLHFPTLEPKIDLERRIFESKYIKVLMIMSLPPSSFLQRMSNECLLRFLSSLLFFSYCCDCTVDQLRVFAGYEPQCVAVYSTIFLKIERKGLSLTCNFHFPFVAKFYFNGKLRNLKEKVQVLVIHLQFLFSSHSSPILVQSQMINCDCCGRCVC